MKKEDKHSQEGIPLSPHFMLTSIIGFFISVYVIYPRWMDWGFTFCLVFIIMFISSMVSMSKTAIPHRAYLDYKKK